MFYRETDGVRPNKLYVTGQEVLRLDERGTHVSHHSYSELGKLREIEALRTGIVEQIKQFLGQANSEIGKR